MTATRIGLTRIALSLCIAMAPGAFASQVARPGQEAQSSATSEKVRAARVAGEWTVERGESLLRICRLLSDDPEVRRKLAIAILEDNPRAFIDADRTRIRVGANLRLRTELVSATISGNGAVTRATIPSIPANSGRNGAGRLQAPLADPAMRSNGNGSGKANGIDRSPPQVTAPQFIGPAYRDQLIGGLAAEAEETAPREPRDLSPGLRSWAVDYRMDYRNSGSTASSTTHGIALLHRRETERYGDFALDAQMGYLQAGLSGATAGTTTQKLTLYHDQFAVVQGVTASSQLGVTRTNLTPWLANSHRIFLPTSLMGGFATNVETPMVTWNASVGQIGRVVGLNVQGFERTSGSTATVGASTAALPGWQLAANAVTLKDNDQVPDNAALTVGAKYQAGDFGPIRVQGVVDDERNKGFWADVQWRDGRQIHRLGAYQIDPDTRFGEGYLTNDTRAAYYRGEFRRAYDFVGVGLDISENNLDRRPDRAGESSVGGYGSATLKLDRTMSVGGSLSLRQGRPRIGDGDTSFTGTANAFASYLGELGFSRIDLNFAHLRQGFEAQSQEARSISWNQNWPRWGGIRWNTLATLSDEKLSDRNIRRTVFSAGAGGPLAQDLRWDVSVTAARLDDGQSVERDYNATVTFDWNIRNNWYLHLQWYRTQIQTASLVSPNIPFVRENQVQLALRYEESYGTPYPRLAGPGGRSGTGSVTGSVYFDENGDGVRQATERGVPGITVFLDRRQTQVTDREGRFSFPIVPSGNRSVTISLDRVPLPWGLADESPRTTDVPVRGDSRVDVGLTRMAP